MKVNVKNIIFFLLLILVFVFGAMLLTDIGKKPETIAYGDLVEAFEQNKVTKFEVDSNAKISITYYPKNAGTDTWATETKTISYKFSYDFQLEEINALAKENYAKTGADKVLT